MIIKKFEAFTGLAVGGIETQQTNSDLPRSSQISSTESVFSNDVPTLKDLEKGLFILYRGTKYEIIEEGEFAIKVKELNKKTMGPNKTMFINQSQISKYGISITK